MKKHRIVALLPMKANSQRVAGKNFREFCGKPLFRWMLDTLIELPEIDKIIINTDARAILADKGLVDAEKIIIRDRRLEICGDLISMNSIIADDLASVPSEIYLMTHVTNPLIHASTIRGALNAFIEADSNGKADSLFTVNKFQSRFYRSDCSPINHDPGNLIPTQDLEPWYEENSNLYIFTAESFMKTGARIGAVPMMYESPHLESIDIDTPQDWELAVVAANYLAQKKTNN